MGKQIITFKFKGKQYRFERPYTPDMSNTTSAWINKCYKSIGAKTQQITCRWMTHSGWSFWCRYAM